MAFITARRVQEHIPCAVACRALGVSPSWYYKWRRGDRSPRHARREQLSVAVRRAFATHHRSQGSPRVLADLREEGFALTVHMVAQVMAELHLGVRRGRA